MKALKAERPYVTAGAVILGAGVVAIAPIAPPTPDVHIVNAGPRLTAASASIANVPVNVIQAIANVPANELVAMQSMANALLFTGSWWTGRPNQIWGTDPADPPKWRAGVAMLMPFPALSEPVGESLAVWAEANLPVNAACHYICHDPGPILLGLGQVPVWQLYTGYTFPTVVNPLGAVEGAYGFPGTGPGNTMPWSGQTVKLDPLEPVTSVIDYLVAPPTGIKQVSLMDVVTTTTKLGNALILAFSPFTPGGPLTPGWPYSAEACPACAALDATSAPSEKAAPSLTLTSGQTPTLDVTSISLGSDIPRSVVKDKVKSWVKNTLRGDGLRSANGRRDIQAGTPIPPEARSTATHVSKIGSAKAPGAGFGLLRSITAVRKPDSATINSAKRAGDGDTEKPRKSGGGQDKPPVKPGAGVKSVSDRISSSISKATDGLRGGRVKTDRSARTGTGNSRTGTGE